MFLQVSPEVSAEEALKPNIVFILADDLGYGDLSSYGATKISTPNIDKIGEQGMKFTDAHAAASVCSPSRYGFLTGRSPWRLEKKGNGYRIDSDQMTLPLFLKQQGYQTAAIGKWHLGYSKDWNKLPITGPLEKGFTYHFGVPQNHNDSTRVFIENHDIVGRKPGEDFEIVKGQQFPNGVAEPRVDDLVDTTLTKKAIEFIKRSKDQPFFLYFTPCTPHTHVVPAEAFRGTSQAGLLGDQVQELDFHVGEILKTLDELGLAENTLVIFTSDNGGSYKDFKGTNGTVLNLASEAGDVLKKYKSAKEDAKKMGHSTNGHWRDGKGYPPEGGHRVPFLARWPGKIAPGSSSELTLSLTDVFATAADMVDVELPQEAAEDSFSLLPVMMGKKDGAPSRKAVFIQGDTKNNAIAICSGRWKVIDLKNEEGEKVPELYDLHNDPGEMKNLAKAYPEILEEMTGALEKARKDGRTRP
ncbi:sulfatase family protein [Haloferula sp.]|uniref:sulfatase family protein n=1 Tax=Haloferula sp. TaxID=2497595 RepID=UPI00329B6B62